MYVIGALIIFVIAIVVFIILVVRYEKRKRKVKISVKYKENEPQREITQAGLNQAENDIEMDRHDLFGMQRSVKKISNQDKIDKNASWVNEQV